MEPATVPLTGDRWTPFVHTLKYLGEDLTGAAFAMHVRLAHDTPGTPLLTLTGGVGITLVYGGTATVAAHIAAGRLSEVPEGMLTSDSTELSILDIVVTEIGMEALPFVGERGDNAVLAYDMHVTPSGGLKQVYFRGTFTVRAGATQ